MKALRPITRLPFLPKVLEVVVCKQLQDFLSATKVIADSQSGFQPCYSTTSAMTYLNDLVLRSYDRDEVCILVSLDSSKAFDTINHDLFLQKLRYYNFLDVTIHWFESYLKGRSQVVYTYSESGISLSSSVEVTCGVPQSSSLGPSSYITYAADLLRLTLSSIIASYADDTHLFISFKPSEIQNVVNRVNLDLMLISEWSSANFLKLNPDKTTVLIIDPSRRSTANLEASLLLDN